MRHPLRLLARPRSRLTIRLAGLLVTGLPGMLLGGAARAGVEQVTVQLYDARCFA